MKALPKYKSQKIVSAAKICSIYFDVDTNSQLVYGDGNIATLVFEENVPILRVSSDYIKKHNPLVDGYFVQYSDGYQSFSPKKAFEDGYVRLEDGSSLNVEKNILDSLEKELIERISKIDDDELKELFLLWQNQRNLCNEKFVGSILEALSEAQKQNEK